MAIHLQGCGLDSAGLAGAAARYAAAAEGYSAHMKLGDDEAVIQLHGLKPALADLLDEMISRESGCCSHLSFDVEESETGYAVTLRSASPESSALNEALSVLFPTAVPATTPQGSRLTSGAAPGPVRG